MLLVEDHLLVRRGFRRMLEDDPDIRGGGEAERRPGGGRSRDRERPAVVVMDFALPSMNGAVATRKLLESARKRTILMLSMHSEPDYVRMCLEAGARGYLLKNAMDLELVEAVKKRRGRSRRCWIRDWRCLAGRLELPNPR